MTDKQREFEYTWDDFNFLRKKSNAYSGILVPDDKFDMFYSRLSKRLRLLGFDNFKSYCTYLDQYPEHEFTEFINAVTTNLTSFFREPHHFEYLRKTVLPELVKKKAGSRQIRVWSAGCSTGEEPYSLAITLLETLPENWNIRILATDIDTNVLMTATEGVYGIDRVQSLGEKHLKQWFLRGKGTNQHRTRVKPELQRLIKFKPLNLMEDWPMTKPFDFIFCRNVLIYFDRDTKERLIAKFADLLPIGGHLFIGHSESLHQLTRQFKLIGNTIYERE